MKYRRKIFNAEISDYARNMFVRLGEEYNIILVEWNHDEGHVHILLKAHQNSELSKFINAYKSASSRLMKRDFPRIKQKLWKEHVWSRSVCLLTIGGSHIEVIKKYIENQGLK